MRTRIAGAVIVWTLLASCESCGGAPDGGFDGGVDAGALPTHALDPVTACKELVSAAAGYENRCGRLASADLGVYEGAQCPEALFGPRELAFDAGLLAYDRLAVECVLSGLQAGLDGGLACNAGNPVPNPGCGQLAWGVLPAGAVCDDVFSCSLGFYCERASQASPCGVCARNVPNGAGCGPTAQGAFCTEGVCNGGTCRQLVGRGAACTLDTAVCSQPLSCHVEGCQNPGGADAGCSTDADCTDGLRCGTFTSRCLPPVSLGGDCSLQGCAEGLACQSVDGGNVCVPLTAAGPCVAADAGPLCPELETCRDGGCVVEALLAGACGVPADCASGTCVGGSCGLLPAGSACSRDTACQTQRCDIGATNVCGAACP